MSAIVEVFLKLQMDSIACVCGSCTVIVGGRGRRGGGGRGTFPLLRGFPSSPWLTSNMIVANILGSECSIAFK